jgi:hypothetical protein
MTAYSTADETIGSPPGPGWRELAEGETAPPDATQSVDATGKHYVHVPRPRAPHPVDPRTIPALRWLTDPMHRRWVGWQYRWVVDDKGKGKWTKVPVQANGRSNARNNDHTTWASFDQVWLRIDQFDGIGVMLKGLGGEYFAAIDLDDVRDPVTEAIAPWAAQLIHDSGSYAEVTVSGAGLRILGTAEEIEKLHRRLMAHPSGHGSAELYVNCERYITISGQVLNGATALTDITPQLRELEALLDKPTDKPIDNGGGEEGEPAAPIKLEELSPVIIELLTKGTLDGKPIEKRGPQFMKVVRHLHGKGHSFTAVLALLQAHPNGVQAKYAKRLEAALRSAWNKVAAAQPGPVSDAAFQAEVERLAQLNELRYEREAPDAAKKLGIARTALDRLVRIERAKLTGDTNGQGRPLELPPPEPWPDWVDGATLLDGLAQFFSDHSVLLPHASNVLALWSVHCFCFYLFDVTPRLRLKSVEKRSGKSTVIDLLKLVTPKPIDVETVSVAFLFRAIEMAQPTVLLDETDRYVSDNPEMIAVINAGAKRGGKAGRCVGEDLEPRLFNCFAPMALAGIGKLPDTIEDRSITIMMQRRTREEKIEPIDDAAKQVAERLLRQAARWTNDHANELGDARPDMGKLFNRAADRWRALYAIAEVAGGEWPKLARETMQAMAGDEDAKSLGERLLVDIKQVFDEWLDEEKRAVRLKGGDTTKIKIELTPTALAGRLAAMPDHPWAEMPRSHKPLTENGLSRMLGKFRIITHRERDDQTGVVKPRVYRLTDFDEAFGRYLDA